VPTKTLSLQKPPGKQTTSAPPTNMSRWTKYIEADYGRLSEGMKRIAYDADTERYTYRDLDGSIWQGEPGSQYGKLSLVTKAPGITKSEPSSPSSDSGLNPTSPTSKYGKEKMFAPSLDTLDTDLDKRAPPPPYKRPSRQFTDFDQILGGKKKKSAPDYSAQQTLQAEQAPTSVISRVKRSMSIKKPDKALQQQRRGTL
jgi:hypothetical protein